MRDIEASWPSLSVFEGDFAGFCARFHDIFARPEPRRKAQQYMRALMGPVERRNGWQMAEAMGDERPDAAQRLLYHARWSAVRARELLRDFLVERLGDAEAVVVLDDTGFLKKGSSSVGVARQYSGTAGKVENCQIGVFLAYASSRGHALLDRALYLPKAWCADDARRARAHVPRGVRFRRKPELALRMLRRAWRRGVPMAWVTADAGYGVHGKLRAGIDAAGVRYVMAVISTVKVWISRLALEPKSAPRRVGKGRPRVRPWLAPGVPPPQSAAATVAAWPRARWRRLAVVFGEKGPIEYEWAAERVIECRERRPARESWLLARRSLSPSAAIAYYLSNAPADTSLETLARVASTRYAVEQCFEEAKDDLGLDQYEVRTWPSWHRHVTLTMMAGAWLASVRAKLGEPGSELARACRQEEDRAGARLPKEKKAPRPSRLRASWLRGASPKSAA